MNERTGHATQAFVADREPRESRFDRPENTGELANKPAGGLWTSTLRDDGTSAWVEWCRAERWGLTDESRLFTLEPDADVSVLVVDSETDLHALLDRFGRDDPGFLPKQQFARIDFERIATAYDAVHLTDAGQRATRFSRPGLYGWDCESTLWTRWCFDAVVDLGAEALPTTEAGDE